MKTPRLKFTGRSFRKSAIIGAAVLSTMLAVATSRAQTQFPDFMWAKQSAAPYNGFYDGLATDVASSVFMVGAFNGTVDFDPGTTTANMTSAGGTDGYLVKIDTGGNFQWAKQIGGTGNDNAYTVTADASGNIYVVGSITSPTATFGTTTLTRTGAEDAYILKLSPTGTLIWKAQIGGGPGAEVYPASIAVDASGNVVAGGSFAYTVDFDPGAGTSTMTCASDFYEGFVVKLNSSGAYQWARQFKGDDFNGVRSVATDASGGVYAAGIFEDTIDCNPGAAVQMLTTAGAVDIFVTKLDASGNYVWSAHEGGIEPDWCRGMKVTPAGEVVVTGTFDGTADFNMGGTPQVLSSFGTMANPDVFVWKLNANGSFSWVRQLGNQFVDKVEGLALDDEGNIYTTGMFAEAVDFNPTPGNNYAYLTAASGCNDAFISKLDPEGDYIWAVRLGGANASVVHGYSIAVDTHQNVFTAGMLGGTADFNQTTTGVLNLSAANGSNFLHKMGKIDSTGGSGPTSVVDSAAVHRMTILPNPTTGRFQVLRSAMKNAELEVRDVTGRKVHAQSGVAGNEVSVDLSGHPAGVYFIQLSEGGQQTVSKIILQ